MGGFNCLPKATRLFITWPPGNATPHEKRLEVSQYIANQMEPGGIAHQFDYDDFVGGLAKDAPGYHMRLKGVIDRAREMAGCDVQVWLGITVIPESIGFNTFETLSMTTNSAVEISGLDLSAYEKEEENEC